MILSMVIEVVYGGSIVGRCVLEAVNSSKIWALLLPPAEDAVNFATIMTFMFLCCSGTYLRLHVVKAPCPSCQGEVPL